MTDSVRGYAGPLIMVFTISVLLTTMPSMLIATGSDVSNPDLPPFYSGINFGAYNNLANVTINLDNFAVLEGVVYSYSFDLGGDTYLVLVDSSLTYIKVGKALYATILFVLPVLTGYSYFSFINVKGQERGDSISLIEMDADYLLTSNQAVIKYSGLLSDDNTRIDVFLGWNQSVYSTPSQAFQDETMIFLAAGGLNNTMSANGGIALLLGLLFFQVPNVPYPINLLLSGIFYLPLIIIGIKILAEVVPG